MGPTVNQIEANIDRAREKLGSNLHELERRVDAITDWREHYRARPLVFLGAAAVGGLFAAAMFRNGSRSGRYYTPAGQSNGAWDVVKAAAIGLAASRLRGYVDTLVPGFDEHYQRAEQRTAADRFPGR
jgi:Protein of unknown function (DUF3618)